MRPGLGGHRTVQTGGQAVLIPWNSMGRAASAGVTIHHQEKDCEVPLDLVWWRRRTSGSGRRAVDWRSALFAGRRKDRWAALLNLSDSFSLYIRFLLSLLGRFAASHRWAGRRNFALVACHPAQAGDHQEGTRPPTGGMPIQFPMAMMLARP